jgi:hypothetical protein
MRAAAACMNSSRANGVRVLHLHKRMIHAPEDIMCYAIQGKRPLWKNTNVTPTERHTPLCFEPAHVELVSLPRRRLRTAKDRKPSTKEEMDTQDVEDIKLYKPGELLSCDNVAKSFEGCTQTFIWRDTATKRMFSHSDSEATEEVQGHPDRRLHHLQV